MTPTKEQHQQHIDQLYRDWQVLENVDRGYDFKAASAARDKYYLAIKFHQVWYGV